MKIKTPLTVKAFAKINLGLFITRKRDDGYHTLSTLFAPIDWYDILSFSAADAIEMSCTNLICRLMTATCVYGRPSPAG